MWQFSKNSQWLNLLSTDKRQEVLTSVIADRITIKERIAIHLQNIKQRRKQKNAKRRREASGKKHKKSDRISELTVDRSSNVFVEYDLIVAKKESPYLIRLFLNVQNVNECLSAMQTRTKKRAFLANQFPFLRHILHRTA